MATKNKKSDIKQIWLILGANSAIARAYAHEAAATGADIILAGRDLEELERSASDLAIRHQIAAHVVEFDVLHKYSYPAFIQRCAALCSDRVLNLFIAVGNMFPQADLEQDPALTETVLYTNYIGVVTLLTHCLPMLEQQGAGHIVVLGSVAGDRGRPSNYVYGSAKAGLCTYLQGLRARLASKGVKVTTIKPGFIDTAMTFGLPGLFLVASPQACAKACFEHARKDHGEAYFPWFWRYIMLIIKSIPDRIFKKMKL